MTSEKVDKKIDLAKKLISEDPKDIMDNILLESSWKCPKEQMDLINSI